MRKEAATLIGLRNCRLKVRLIAPYYKAKGGEGMASCPPYVRLCLQVSCFRENIGEEQKNVPLGIYFQRVCGVTLPTKESHITPRG